MIIDAPLCLSNEGRYYVLGDTGVTRQLVSIIEAVRPGARFAGYVDAVHQAKGAPLIVCDLRVDEAKRLVRRGISANVLIMPLPVGDYWSYWEFSKRVGQEIGFDGRAVTMPDGAFTDMLLSTKRAAADKFSGILPITPDQYLSRNPEILLANQEKVRQVIETLSDHSSRQAYSTVVTGSPEACRSFYLDRVFRSVQYFEHIDYGRCHTVINGGVFDGHEIPFLVAKLPADATVHNFDPLGHDYLTDYSAAWMTAGSQNFVEHRIALWQRDGEHTFATEEDGQIYSHTSSEPNDTKAYPCRSVDSFVEQTGLDRVDLIKFDLEGADLHALIGAFYTIEKFRPQLAISIYHRMKEFWEIPIVLFQLCENYEFHLGYYSFERFETILYCIPKEISRTQ